VSFASSKNEKSYTRLKQVFFLVVSWLLFFSIVESVQAWEVDFSRRELDLEKLKEESRLPAAAPVGNQGPLMASATEASKPSLLEKMIEVSEPSQDIVILNTEKGFVPENIKLRRGGNYRIHIVNVNEERKNVSFVLDAFSEHHNTVFGKERSFTLNPKQDGPFSFQCPETGRQGQIFVFSENRTPASE
jgi:hypothetical protein